MKNFSTIARLKTIQLMAVMMFWFGIEQLFLDNIIQDSSARMWTTIAFTGGLLLFDVPTGMLADAFGRKRAVLVGFIVLIVSLLLLGTSSNVLIYALAALLYSLYWSFINGASQALLYEHLKSIDLSHLYARNQGSIYAFGFIGAAIANVASGFIAQEFGLRAPYYLSLVPAIIAFIVALGLPESKRATSEASKRWYAHLDEVTSVIRRRPRILISAATFFVTVMVALTFGEFGQILILSYGVSTTALGIWWAVVATAAAGGRLLAHRMQKFPVASILLFIVAIVLFISTHSTLGLILYCVVYALNELVWNVAETNIQDETPSNIRSTMLSSFSFIGNTLAIPVVIWFNHLLQSSSIQSANQTTGVFYVGLLMAIITIYTFKQKPQNKTPIAS